MTETAKEAARRFAAPIIAQGFEPVALHRYTAPDGSELYCRIRAKHPVTGEKWIRPMYANGSGYKLGEPDFAGKLKPLYRLHELAEAAPGSTAWWVEGEQKADKLAALGFLATTAGGANDDEGRDFALLRGLRVLIWPDNDAPGQAHAQRVADRLRALGATVEIIDVAALGLPDGGDVCDYLAAHPDATAADLMALPRNSKRQITAEQGWPDPAPLPAELPAVEPFDLALLPDALRPWIADIADRVQCPPDFPAVAAMVALGSVLGRKVCIRPKRLDSWYEAANLWGVIVGSPGVLKSPALNEALRPLRELEGRAAEDYSQAMAEWQATKARREIDRTAAKQAALKAARKGDQYSTDLLIDGGDDEEPAPRRYVVNDTSVEALGEVLMRNPNGTLAYRDELVVRFQEVVPSQREEEADVAKRQFLVLRREQPCTRMLV